MAAKSPPLPFMTLWVSNHLSSTGLLSLAQCGATINLLCNAWIHGPLPNDAATLMRMMRVTSKEYTTDVEPILKAQFVLRKDGWINDALEVERAKSIRYRTKALERSARGGETTKDKWDKDHDGMAAALAAKKAASLAAGKAISPAQATPEPRSAEGYSSLDSSTNQSQTTHTSERESGTDARKEARLDVSTAEAESPKQPAHVQPAADVARAALKRLNGNKPRAPEKINQTTAEDLAEYAAEKNAN
jgi:uncharacterized protein YdaU (DUF1376 family)